MTEPPDEWPDDSAMYRKILVPEDEEVYGVGSGEREISPRFIVVLTVITLALLVLVVFIMDGP